MTRHGSASPRSESLVLPATMPPAPATPPIDPATVSSPDPGQHLRRTLPPGAVFQPTDAHHTNRCARPTTRRKPKSPYPTLRDLTFALLEGVGVLKPETASVDRVLCALRQHVPDGEGASLPEIVTAGWLHLRERGGLSLDDEASEYQMLNELMLKSVEVSEFKLRVDEHA